MLQEVLGQGQEISAARGKGRTKAQPMTFLEKMQDRMRTFGRLENLADVITPEQHRAILFGACAALEIAAAEMTTRAHHVPPDDDIGRGSRIREARELRLRAKELKP
jgi:hypothetical protein